jgi:tRNA 2-thiouridine synthesizing protein B
MAMLHTVNKSPFERDALGSCLTHALAGSSILLLEDGVIGAVEGNAFADQIKGAMSNVSVYVLGEDLHARGLTDDKVIDGITVVDYKGFVDLTAKNDKVQSWL